MNITDIVNIVDFKNIVGTYYLIELFEAHQMIRLILTQVNFQIHLNHELTFYN